MEKDIIDATLKWLKEEISLQDIYDNFIEWWPELQPIEIKSGMKKAIMLFKQGY